MDKKATVWTFNNLIEPIILVSSGFYFWTGNLHVPVLDLHLIFLLLLFHQSRAGSYNLQRFTLRKHKGQYKLSKSCYLSMSAPLIASEEVHVQVEFLLGEQIVCQETHDNVRDLIHRNLLLNFDMNLHSQSQWCRRLFWREHLPHKEHHRTSCRRRRWSRSWSLWAASSSGLRRGA